MTFDTAYRIIPNSIYLEESGDLVYLGEDENYLRFALIDGLGHGMKAHSASSRAVRALESNPPLDPAAALNDIHRKLKQTVGAVGAVCIIEKSSGTGRYAGIGNVITRSLSNKDLTFIPQDGHLGSSVPTIRETRFSLLPGDIILMYSDGVREHFDLLSMPGLEKECAKSITEKLISTYSKQGDDASMITIKALP